MTLENYCTKMRFDPILLENRKLFFCTYLFHALTPVFSSCSRTRTQSLCSLTCPQFFRGLGWKLLWRKRRESEGEYMEQEQEGKQRAESKKRIRKEKFVDVSENR